jgi:hypothetical protein
MESKGNNGVENGNRDPIPPDIITSLPANASAPPMTLNYPALSVLYNSDKSSAYPELPRPRQPDAYPPPPYAPAYENDIRQPQPEPQSQQQQDEATDDGDKYFECPIEEMPEVNFGPVEDVKFFMFAKLDIARRERLLGLLTIEILFGIMMSLVVVCVAMASPMSATGDGEDAQSSSLKFVTSACIIVSILCLSEALVAFLCVTRLKAGMMSFQKFMAIKLALMVMGFIISAAGGLTAIASGGHDRKIGRFMDISGTLLLLVIPVMDAFLFCYQVIIITHGNITCTIESPMKDGGECVDV